MFGELACACLSFIFSALKEDRAVAFGTALGGHQPGRMLMGPAWHLRVGVSLTPCASYPLIDSGSGTPCKANPVDPCWERGGVSHIKYYKII